MASAARSALTHGIILLLVALVVIGILLTIAMH
jgi:hypothetical protein